MLKLADRSSYLRGGEPQVNFEDFLYIMQKAGLYNQTQSKPERGEPMNQSQSQSKLEQSKAESTIRADQPVPAAASI